ncbi:SRPBCC family protein [Longitalea arenae]|uniref:SRPBCC family protein n=1 Tax=Longitalea arenae TaxID=2812558 RepID=UPI001967FEC5|nr:SRPBCC family protein [Longitalea arenae]
MSIYYLKTEQLLPVDIQQAWAFFSSPGNLARITPPAMDFKTLTDIREQEIYTGMLIDYTVKPLFGIPLHWRTEIIDVKKPFSFKDVQLKGPYRLWEHTHTFQETEDGVLMQDLVKYQLPFGPLGRLTHALLVRKKLEDLFAYRKAAIERIFK